MDKKMMKLSLITILIIILIVSIFSLFNWNILKKERIYGASLEEKISKLNIEVNKLEKDIETLKSRNSALFLLVFIALILNLLTIAGALYKLNKRKKEAISGK